MQRPLTRNRIDRMRSRPLPCYPILRPKGNRTLMLHSNRTRSPRDNSIRRHKANPFTPTLRSAGFQLAVHLLAIAVFPKRQSLPDFTAGIVSTTSDQ